MAYSIEEKLKYKIGGWEDNYEEAIEHIEYLKDQIEDSDTQESKIQELENEKEDLEDEKNEMVDLLNRCLEEPLSEDLANEIKDFMKDE